MSDDRPRHLRIAGVLALAAGFTAACDSPSDPRREATPPLYVVSVDSLVPGGTATMRGANMRHLRQLAVDGHEAAFRIISDTEVSFDVPILRPCEVDGRRAEISINGSLGSSAVVRPADVIRLEVGESRVVQAADVACMKLPDGDEDFVFSVASFSAERLLEPVFRLRALSATGAQPAAAALTAPHVPDLQVHAERLLQPPPAHALADAGGFSLDSYATALPGDVLRFVDWSSPAAALASAVEQLPTYTATVVVVTPGQLIVVDNRSHDAAGVLAAAARARLQAAAEIVDRVKLDALRAVIRPDLRMPEGAGGRMVTTLRPMNNTAGSIQVEELQPRLGASGFYHTVLNTSLVGFTPETIARIMIHEAAHLADFEGWLRDPAAGRSSVGWYSEAIAVAAEDAAARLAAAALGTTGASGKPRALEGRWPAGVPRSSIAHSASPGAPLESPFGMPGSAAGGAGPGAYDRGARILRYAQERLADSGQTLHQRLAAAAPPRSGPLNSLLDAWSVEAVAHTLGITPRELLRNSMLADLTNDLVPADAVRRWQLPQVGAWDHAPATDRDYGAAAGGRVIARLSGFTADVVVPSGGYAYWYVPAGTAGGGLTLHATGISLREDHEVRITRLR
jgi:hypothetical protein